MDIPIGAEVFCTDGFCGRSTRVVLKPKTEEVTHLVVKEKESPHKEILIPVTAVTATTPDSINLSYTRGTLAQLEPFLETEYITVDIPRYVSGVYTMATDFYRETEVLPVKHEAIPEGELAVHRGARVEATDGYVGRVDEFLVDPENDHITHISLREGHLWGRKGVAVPVSQIQRMSEDTVYLKLDKRGVEALPATPVGWKRR
jgi:sporulation protein YlmC with PRC-barrel domain